MLHSYFRLWKIGFSHAFQQINFNIAGNAIQEERMRV